MFTPNVSDITCTVFIIIIDYYSVIMLFVLLLCCLSVAIWKAKCPFQAQPSAPVQNNGSQISQS